MVRDYIMEHKLYKRDDPFKTTVTSSQYTLKASREITQSDLDFITSVTKEDIMVHVREEKPTVLRFIATDTDELLCVVLYEKIEIIDLYYYFRHIPTSPQSGAPAPDRLSAWCLYQPAFNSLEKNWSTGLCAYCVPQL